MRVSRRSRDALIVATGIAILSAAGLFTLGYLIYRDDHPPFHARPFDRASWLALANERGTMLNDLFRSGAVRPCMKRVAVVNLLGPPSRTQRPRTLVYEVGRYRLDPGNPLYLTFDLKQRLDGVVMPVGSSTITGNFPTGRYWEIAGVPLKPNC
jgi:hypothetical protein